MIQSFNICPPIKQMPSHYDKPLDSKYRCDFVPSQYKNNITDIKKKMSVLWMYCTVDRILRKKSKAEVYEHIKNTFP